MWRNRKRLITAFLLLAYFLAPSSVLANDNQAKCRHLAQDPLESNQGVGVPLEQIDHSSAVRFCEKAVQMNPAPKNHYRLARALYRGIRSGNSNSYRAAGQSAIERFHEHLTVAFKKNYPAALFFATLLKKTKFIRASARDYWCQDCLLIAAQKGIEPAKAEYVRNGNVVRDDIAKRFLANGLRERKQWAVEIRISDIEYSRNRLMIYRYSEYAGDENKDKDIIFWKKIFSKAAQIELRDLYEISFDANPAVYGFRLAEISLRIDENPTNPNEIVSWLKSAIPSLTGRAETLLGKLFLDGRLVGHDSKQSIALFEKARKLGNPLAPYILARIGLLEQAQYNEEKIADLLLEADDSIRRIRKAVSDAPKDTDSDQRKAIGYESGELVLMRRLIAPVLGPIMYRRAAAYARGSGAAQDLVKAAEYYDIASAQGIQKAQLALAYMRRYGQGVAKSSDWEGAYFSRASRCGNLGLPPPYECDPKLKKLAALEYQNVLNRRYPPAGSDFAKWVVVGIVGLAIIAVLNGGADVDQHYDSGASRYVPQRSIIVCDQRTT